MTDGEREIDGRQFYLRLAHALCICSVREPLPAFCMRWMPVASVRGGGNAGDIRRSVCRYQKNEAWTWEHQALVRARVVTAIRSSPRTLTQYAGRL